MLLFVSHIIIVNNMKKPTGTNLVGYCYVGALENQGRTFVVALLACGWPNNKNYKWADTRKLMKYGTDHYYYRSFLDEETIFDKKWLEPIPVEEGCTLVLGDTAYVQVDVRAIQAEQGLTEHSPGGETGDAGHVQNENAGPTPHKKPPQLEGLLMKAGEEIVVEYHQEKALTAPVKAGTVVGSIRYMVEGVTYRQEDIVTTDSVEKIDWKWCLKQIFLRFFM